MRAVILLAVLVAILHFGLRYYVTPQFGEDVEARFIERSKTIPSIQSRNMPGNDGALNEANLALWLNTHANDAARRGYVVPVIIPFDLLFLISLGSLLGFASVLLASQIGAVSQFSPMLWWLFPIAYVACDVIEDSFIAALLTWPDLLNAMSFRLLRSATAAKFVTIAIAVAQAGVLGIGWCVAAGSGFLK
jgi:hypothetical protein